MRLEDLMERAAQYDENLARDIKDYVHGRKYGLVYEASKPEFVRMWKKPVVREDIVNILPPRGVMEDTKNDDDPSEIVYKVISISGGVATLRNEQTDEIATASVDDIVALARFDKPIYAGLKETGRIERGGDKPYHVVINGENYHALQTLVYAYQGQVDCIYIDPPYNTGAKDWKYNNNYVGEDDIYRHSKWLTFIEDRLKLAKKLLNPKTGVLIITIDEHEVHRLRMLLEQLFTGYYIQMCTDVINPKGTTQGRFSRVEEYNIFCFAPNAFIERSVDNLLNPVEEDRKPRWKGLLRSGTSARREDRENMFYPVLIDAARKCAVKAGNSLPYPETPDYSPVDGYEVAWPIRRDGSYGRWGVGNDTLNRLIDKGFVSVGNYDKKRKTWGISYISLPNQKLIEKGDIIITGRDKMTGVVSIEYAHKDTRAIKTVWHRTSHDAGAYGTDLISSMIGNDRQFPFPKSLYSVHDALRTVLRTKKDAIIVDFFAGSGTSAHAVMLLNRWDNGTRRCISITNNEVSENEQEKLVGKNLRQGDKEWEQYGICDYITKPRISAAISGLDVNGKQLAGIYGTEIEVYSQLEDMTVTENETGKTIRNNVYIKKKIIDPSIPDPFPMSDGFEQNAVFFDLEYLEPSVVSADLAFDRIAPILWLCGGCEGRILHRQKGFVIGETYAILFDPRYKTRFVDAVTEKKRIKTVFIVTDAAERYRTLCAELPDCRVMQLYESYLRSFEINAIG